MLLKARARTKQAEAEVRTSKSSFLEKTPILNLVQEFLSRNIVKRAISDQLFVPDRQSQMREI